MSTNNTVIVTGAAGWLGSSLVRAILTGLPEVNGLQTPSADRVRALVMNESDKAVLADLAQKIDFVIGDLRNPADCAKLLAGSNNALIYHTAGIIHPARVRDFYDINVQGSKNLLEAAKGTKARRIVVVSSNSPCGCNPNTEHRFNESSPYNPYQNYGKSKMQMEKLFAEQHGSLEYVIIRCPWFYGPYQPARQTLFFKMIKEGKAPIVGNGSNVRSMSYLDNLAQGLILAGKTSGANGKTYWISDERAYSMNEIIDTVEHLLEEDFGIKCAHGRMRLPWIAGEVAEVFDTVIQGAGLYHQKIHVLSEMNKNIACDVSLAKRELGYKPSVDLAEGMRRSIRWVLDNGQWEEARLSATPKRAAA